MSKSICPECGENELITNKDLLSGLCENCRKAILEEHCYTEVEKELKKDAEELEQHKQFETEP